MSRSSSRYIPTATPLTLVTSVTLAVKLARYSREHLFRILPSSATEYTWGHDEAAVTAGNGFPLASGETIAFDEEVLGTTIYFRQTSGGNVVLHHGFMRPHGGI